MTIERISRRGFLKCTTAVVTAGWVVSKATSPSAEPQFRASPTFYEDVSQQISRNTSEWPRLEVRRPSGQLLGWIRVWPDFIKNGGTVLLLPIPTDASPFYLGPDGLPPGYARWVNAKTSVSFALREYQNENGERYDALLADSGVRLSDLLALGDLNIFSTTKELNSQPATT